MTDEKEILTVLKAGKEILCEHPEFEDMSLNDVLNELDDGTEEMIHKRWGVTAWLVVKSINNFEIRELVKHLSKIESGILTYEYAGYLLQTECHVNMEELLLESNRCGEFNKIVLYVCENIEFWTELHPQYIPEIIRMLEKHKDYKNYYTIKEKYTSHINKVGAQFLVESILGDLDGQAAYDVMRALRWEWYRRDVAEASGVIGRMLERNSIWSKKAAIDFWEVSLNYDVCVFHQYFNQIESLISKDNELRQMIIQVFVQYVMIFSPDKNKVDGKIYGRVLKYLREIPTGSIEEKRDFLKSPPQGHIR